MHNDENITCDICGLKVARIKRSWFFGWPKRYVEFSYVTITDSVANWHKKNYDGVATDSTVHLCHDCFRELKVAVLCKKGKENKDEQATNS